MNYEQWEQSQINLAVFSMIRGQSLHRWQAEITSISHGLHTTARPNVHLQGARPSLALLQPNFKCPESSHSPCVWTSHSGLEHAVVSRWKPGHNRLARLNMNLSEWLNGRNNHINKIQWIENANVFAIQFHDSMTILEGICLDHSGEVKPQFSMARHAWLWAKALDLCGRSGDKAANAHHDWWGLSRCGMECPINSC
jgi:hypothetical protein